MKSLRQPPSALVLALFLVGSVFGAGAVRAQTTMRVMGAPQIIVPGSQVSVVVDYATPIPNNVVISLIDNNFAWKAGTATAIAAGAGQVTLTFTAPSNLVANDNYSLTGYIDEDTGNWQNPDVTAASHPVKVRSSVNANLVDHKVVAAAVDPGAAFRFCVSYAATGAKEIKLNVFKGAPGDYTQWRGGYTGTVTAGAGTISPVDITLSDYTPGAYFAAISIGDAGATSGLVYGTALTLSVNDPTPKTNIAPTDTNIRYIGRFNMADPAAPEFDWPGTHIKAKFTGTSVGVKLESTSTSYRYRVFVDGVAQPDIVASAAGNQTYSVATGLADGTHSIEIHKKNEDDYDIKTTKFRGFVLDQGRALAAPDAAPTRKILVIGDSYTAGYGAAFTGSARTAASHAEKLAYDDTYTAYGPQVARHYEADYQIVARSGIGVYCKNNSISSADSMRNRYDNTLFGYETPAYTMGGFVPQLIIINLGINDFATWAKPSAPTQTQFEDAYKSFIDSLRGHYPDAKFLLVTQASSPASWHAYVQNVATAKSASYQHVTLSGADLGLDWHPTPTGHTTIKNSLVTKIETMGVNWAGGGSNPPPATTTMRVIGAPEIIVPGSQVNVVVDYATPIANNVVISLIDNTFVWRAGTATAVPAGSGQVTLTFTAPANLTPNDGFILTGYIDENTANWQNPDVTAANYTVKVRASVNANLIRHSAISSNATAGSPFRLCASYAATGPKQIKVNLFRGSPGDYTQWAGSFTANVTAGAGVISPVEVSPGSPVPGSYFASIQMGDPGASTGLVYGAEIPLTLAAGAAGTEISPENPNIRYIGRFNTADPAAPEFDWPGTHIKANFTGTSVGVKLESTSTAYRYRVFVDGVAQADIVASTAGNQTYSVATGLANGTHSIEIHKKNEDDSDTRTTKFKGLVLDSGASLAAPDTAPARRLLVVGDSISVGYGAAFSGAARAAADHAEKLAADDTYIAYGPQVARHYGADYQIIARSGYGVYCKNNDISPAESMRNRHDNTLFAQDALAYSAAQFQPQVIVVNLGINDFATYAKAEVPTQAEFEAAYNELLLALRTANPSARFLLVTESSSVQPWHAYVQNVAAANGALYVPVLYQSGDQGLDWHPNLQGQTRIAQAIISALDGAGDVWETLSTWRTTHFGSSANTGDAADLADPDADGFPNLLEYALGGVPDSFASRPETPVSISTDRLAITFDRLRGDLTYTVQGSDDLAAWTDLATNPGAIGENITYIDSENLASAPRRFLRVKVTPAP
ncbi:MAG: hypothetical protein Fur0032_10770 [Terrimicrobiaceae bacterium]